MACYDGPNPVKDDERLAIWKWAKENAGINQGVPIEKVHNAINKYFFNGVAKPEWINDILSGRKTPFREVANDVWRAQYNRRNIIQQAKDLSRLQNMNPVERAFSKMWTAPRELATLGHGIVFPITHAGDLIFRPSMWDVFFKGFFQTYQGFFSKAFTGRMLAVMRYNLWEKKMMQNITPEMSEAEVLDYGKNFADWANHATGSVKMAMP